MRYLIFTLFSVFLILLFAFTKKDTDKVASEITVATIDTLAGNTVATDTIEKHQMISQATNFVEYAKTLMGTPYLYGSTDPDKGLDCSGFINAVSNHFGIKVPRSSVEFTNVGRDIESANAEPGDFILFTGTDPNKRIVGHMGIVTDNNDGHLKFIHSSSGKAKGVTTSYLDGYYQTRFVKVIRIFPVATSKETGEEFV